MKPGTKKPVQPPESSDGQDGQEGSDAKRQRRKGEQGSLPVEKRNASRLGLRRAIQRNRVRETKELLASAPAAPPPASALVAARGLASAKPSAGGAPPKRPLGS